MLEYNLLLFTQGDHISCSSVHSVVAFHSYVNLVILQVGKRLGKDTIKLSTKDQKKDRAHTNSLSIGRMPSH